MTYGYPDLIGDVERSTGGNLILRCGEKRDLTWQQKLQIALTPREWEQLKLEADHKLYQWHVGVTENCTRLKSFATHDEAAEFIDKLPGAADGFYYLDGPEEK
jgi:hypothetical protein